MKNFVFNIVAVFSAIGGTHWKFINVTHYCKKGIPDDKSRLLSSTSTIDQRAIAKAWGVSRLVFPETLKKLQISRNLERKLGSGPVITVMTLAVKKRLVKILIDHNGDLDFKSWEEEIVKDERLRLTPEQQPRWKKYVVAHMWVKNRDPWFLRR